MPRIIPVIIVVAILIGGLIFLSTRVKEQPTHTIEVVVPQGAPAGGNAH